MNDLVATLTTDVFVARQMTDGLRVGSRRTGPHVRGVPVRVLDLERAMRDAPTWAEFLRLATQREAELSYAKRDAADTKRHGHHTTHNVERLAAEIANAQRDVARLCADAVTAPTTGRIP